MVLFFVGNVELTTFSQLNITKCSKNQTYIDVKMFPSLGTNFIAC